MPVASHSPLDPTVPAVAVNLDPYGYHHGQLGAVRSLGRAGVPIWVVVAAEQFPVARSRHLAGSIVWDAASCSDDEVVAGLAMIGERLGACVPVPLDDRLATLLAARADELRPALLLPDVPPDLPRRCADKVELARLCTENDIGTPFSREVSDDEGARSFLSEAGPPPYVVKIIRPWTDHIGADLPRAGLVDERELRDLVARADGPLLLQQYVPGVDVMAHGYVDRNGAVSCVGTGVKVRSIPPGSGPTVAGRGQAFPAVADATRALLAATRYRGGAGMDFRVGIDGRPLLVDFNPRQGAQFRLFERADGMDLSRALHLDMTGRDVGAGEQLLPKCFRVEQNELRVARQYVRQDGIASFGGGRGHTEWAWWAKDDPAPFLAMVRSHLQRRRGPLPPGPRVPRFAPC